MQQMQRCSLPIPCSSFNNDGTIFAYAVGLVLVLEAALWSGVVILHQCYRRLDWLDTSVELHSCPFLTM